MIVAAFDRDDRDHEPCARLLSETAERRVVPAPVLGEADHFLTRYLGADAFVALLDEIERGAIDVEGLVPADYARVSELLRRYADLRVGFVDCAVLAVVERAGERKLATLDHRHFGVLRPAHVDALTLLPVA